MNLGHANGLPHDNAGATVEHVFKDLGIVAAVAAVLALSAEVHEVVEEGD